MTETKKILYIRSFKDIGQGGPVPPIEILSIASRVKEQSRFPILQKVIDLGSQNQSLDETLRAIENDLPDFILIYCLVWEADLVHQLTRGIKDISSKPIICLNGPLVSLVKKDLFIDPHIDYLLIHECENAFPLLINTLISGGNCDPIQNIAYKKENKILINENLSFSNDLEAFTIDAETWNLIEVKSYANFASWNGINQSDFYMPIISSRGCPFDCTFCAYRAHYGKSFRKRSPEEVVNEILELNKQNGCTEFHFYDAVFNYDIQRAKDICKKLISTKKQFQLAFPHGLRADRMDEELIALLKKAGTYKLIYGIETGSERLQKEVHKNLNLEQLKSIITQTSQAGIIVGGYFILGLCNETKEERQATIEFAAKSDLDLAFFFKATDFNRVVSAYNQANNYEFLMEQIEKISNDLAYFSSFKSEDKTLDLQINQDLYAAQKKFYFNRKRLVKLFKKSKKKRLFLKSFLKLCALMIQSYIVFKIQSSASKTRNQL